MKKATTKPKTPAQLVPEYDFRDGARGKYAARYSRATGVVRLDPDVAAEFPTSEAVNRALRALIARRRR